MGRVWKALSSIYDGTVVYVPPVVYGLSQGLFFAQVAPKLYEERTYGAAARGR